MEHRLEYYPSSIKEATVKGHNFYFTGKPCKNGHYPVRKVNTRSCPLCDKLKQERYREKNRSTLNSKMQKYREENAEHVRQLAKDNYTSNREHILDRKKKWRDANPEKDAAIHARYRERHRDSRNEMKRQRRREKKDYDATTAYNNRIDVKISRALRTRLYLAIKNKAKSGSAVRDLGCSIEFFTSYMESLMEPWMSWENWGKDTWHIDHIIPLDAFDLTDREQLLKACHYTNLQPLPAEVNQRKWAHLNYKVN